VEDFLAAPEWRKAAMVQLMNESKKIDGKSKELLTDILTKLAGSTEEYQRLLHLPLFATIQAAVPVPEPSSEFPVAPRDVPDVVTVTAGPFEIGKKA
jgi:hypothetical protein